MTKPREGARIRVKLASLKDCRTELGRLYRRIRTGEVDPQLGRVLIAALVECRNQLEVESIERRLDAIEVAMAHGPTDQTSRVINLLRARVETGRKAG